MKIGLVVVVMVICAVMQVSSSLQLPPKQEVKQSPPYIEKRLVITAKKPQYFTFIPEGVFGVANWTFGPVFNNSVLQDRGEISSFCVRIDTLFICRCLLSKTN